MKRNGGIVRPLIVGCAFLCASAAHGQVWQASINRDAMLDGSRLVLRLRPTRVDDRQGSEPVLIVRCDANSKLDAYIVTSHVIDSEDHYVPVTVRWKRDQPAVEDWTLGDGMTSMFSRTPELFVSRLLVNRQLVIRVHLYSAGNTTAQYTIPALPARYLAMLKKQCGFTERSVPTAGSIGLDMAKFRRDQAALDSAAGKKPDRF